MPLQACGYLHAVERHLHIHQHGKIFGNARRTILMRKSELWSLSNFFFTCMRMRSISMAIMGLFSTKSGNLAGVRPSVETTWGSFSSSVNNRCCSFRVRVFWLKKPKRLNQTKVSAKEYLARSLSQLSCLWASFLLLQQTEIFKCCLDFILTISSLAIPLLIITCDRIHMLYESSQRGPARSFRPL